MVAANDAPLGTAFTVTVDVKHGLTTGISAEQRANTVRALANNNMGATDFVRPGHVFPLIARDGGVLMRSGHTEAAVDLCRLAGLPPVGVICELANDDGTVMKGAADRGLRREARPEADLGRRPHRLPAVAREARRAPGDLPGQDRRRHADRLRLFDALRRRAALRLRLRPDRRRPGHPRPPAPGQRDDGRARRRRDDPGRARALQGRRAGGSWSTCAKARPACRSAMCRTTKRHRAPRTSARSNGARSASARRSCATSASPPSATSARPHRAPSSASRGFGIELLGQETI